MEANSNWTSGCCPLSVAVVDGDGVVGGFGVVGIVGG